MDNQFEENNLQQAPQMEQPQQPELGTSIRDATVHFFVTIGYFLFGVPFALWCKAVNRLAKQRGEGTLIIGRIKSFWPFVTFLKNFLFDFLFDALIFVAYPIGILVGIYAFFSVVTNDYVAHPFLNALSAWIIVLIGTYYTPISFSLIRDLIQFFVVMPIRKLISWIVKPAQHLNLDINK